MLLDRYFRLERWGRFLALGTISMAIALPSCAKHSDQPVEGSIQRLRVINEDPESAERPLSSVLDLDYTDGQSWKTFKSIVQSRLRHRQFEDLDKFADEVRKTGARFPGGGWKLFMIYD